MTCKPKVKKRRVASADDQQCQPSQSKGQKSSSSPQPEQPIPSPSALQSLQWPCKVPFTSVEAENSLLPILLKWGKKERGMMKDQPKYRLHQIKAACQKVNIPLSQALSLRRHHIQQLNPYHSIEQLRLGRMDDIQKSAKLFEESAEQYLRHLCIPIVTERMQKERHFQKNSEALKHGLRSQPLPPTPDFLLEKPIKIIARNEESVVHWIEVKHFYGASSIPNDNKSAVGCILNKSQVYRDLYGPGAIVFAYGAGSELATLLNRMGIMVLDSGPLRMEAVVRHLRSWCADPNGKILP